ncbi:ribosome recycling factor [Candidatus Microgenomates bacterium]|nr:ribosome recycling factor [Candidatus Microgenomates bacterium]
MNNLLNDLKQKMGKAIEVLKGDLTTIRTGRATPSIVEHIVINAYGGTQRLKVMELCTIAAPDHQTLVLTPFDQSIIGEIAKGIQEANVGLNPSIDGTVIRISIPPLSQERRGEFVKLMHAKLEGGRIMIRQIRHEAMADIRRKFLAKEMAEDEKSRLEKQIQELTDEMIAEIGVLGEHKEKELLQI